MRTLQLDSEKARMDAETVFRDPLNIVAEPGLTRGQKIAALERWKQTLQDRLKATGEGMAPPAGQSAEEADALAQISKALEFLERDDGND